ncbi:hypothetical protein SAMN04488038_101452 [Solimonas aquatica]|uniref:MetA-pathway of phenol degradation n=1 Tax=Solimonas aquatica TaxID=489703 RepID=A0A1H9ANY1_9GAMM|nr:hypothetical protein [Solimonas aquatica]SEP77638.1 hypothetical protein SAMN04488038_101452 [Solimonas aquatica]
MTMHRAAGRLGSALWLLMAALHAAQAPAADSLLLSSGTEYSRGQYGGDTQTTVLSVPVSARLRWHDWALRLSVPYVRIHGPADVTVLLDDDGGSDSGSSGSNSGSGSSGSDGSDDGATTVSSPNRKVAGLGDITLSLSHSFPQLGGSPFYLDLIGRVKFASGRQSEGLGTGTTDYSAGGELGWSGAGGGLYAAGARRFVGSTATLQRVDAWQWSGGGWLYLGTMAELGASYSHRQATVATGTDSRMLETTLALLFGASWRLNLYLNRGLSDGAADLGGGLGLSWQCPL